MITVTETLEKQRNSYDSLHQKLKDQIASLDQRVIELTEHNNALHSQFEQHHLSQQKQAQSSADQFASDSDFTPEKYQKLVEVVKYLRREKDIVDTKLQIANGNLVVITKQSEHLQKSLDEARICLEEERSRHENANLSERKHLELMERIEQANLLRKEASNKK